MLIVSPTAVLAGIVLVILAAQVVLTVALAILLVVAQAISAVVLALPTLTPAAMKQHHC